MDPTDVVKLRLHAQRISATTFARPSEVVAWLGAVQAQDYLGALWAVGLRLTEARERDIEGALAEGIIVRTWPMRGTLHFVAAADARWMIELLAPKVVAGAASRLRGLGIDPKTLARARGILVKHLEGGKRLSRPAIYEALSRAKVSATAERSLHILWCLAQECLISFGPRQGKQQTFVLFDEWLPRAKRLPRDEALAELARRYFTGHGPATAADFAWWSGLKLSDARTAIQLAGKRLDQDACDGRAHWFVQAAEPPAPRAPAFLLPAFDELMVGYTDRRAVLEPAFRTQVNAGGGILNPTMVVDGQVVGTWKRRLERGGVVFLPAPFRPLTKRATRTVAHALGRYTAFLGLNPR